MSTVTFPLTPFEQKARIHAHIAFFAFLVALPLGILTARFARTFSKRWFWPHATINFLVTGPLIFAAFALGYQTATASGLGHFNTPHQKGGLALLLMYLIQVLLGSFIHWVKIPFRFPGGRSPQNYLHAILGLSIVALATWQTHYGLWTEWALVTGNLHPVTSKCRAFWLGITISIWALYGLGLLLLPRQFKQEAASRRAAKEAGVVAEGKTTSHESL